MIMDIYVFDTMVPFFWCCFLREIRKMDEAESLK